MVKLKTHSPIYIIDNCQNAIVTAVIWVHGGRCEYDFSFLLSSAIGTDGYCSRSMRPLVLSSVCPSACPSRTTIWSFIDFGYWSEIWRDDTITWSWSQFNMAMFNQFFPISWNFEIFHVSLVPGMREDITALWGLQLSAFNFMEWCTVPRRRSVFKKAMLGQFLCVPRDFKISMTGLYQVWGTTLPF